MSKMDGIDINESYGDLYGSLLVISCLMLDYEMFELLLSKDADPTITHINLTLAEVIYQKAYDLRFYQYLKNSKIDFNKATSTEKTPLSIVIIHSSNFKKKNDNAKYLECLRILDFLLSENVDVNLNSPGDISPLMIASRDDLFDIIKKLIDQGADPLRKYFINEVDKEICCIDYISDLFHKNVKSKAKYDEVLALIGKDA